MDSREEILQISGGQNAQKIFQVLWMYEDRTTSSI